MKSIERNSNKSKRLIKIGWKRIWFNRWLTSSKEWSNLALCNLLKIIKRISTGKSFNCRYIDFIFICFVWHKHACIYILISSVSPMSSMKRMAIFSYSLSISNEKIKQSVACLILFDDALSEWLFSIIDLINL